MAPSRGTPPLRRAAEGLTSGLHRDFDGRRSDHGAAPAVLLEEALQRLVHGAPGAVVLHAVSDDQRRCCVHCPLCLASRMIGARSVDLK